MSIIFNVLNLVNMDIVISKAKYVDANNAVFLYLDGEDLTPTSIYTAIPADFLLMDN